jgi:hypothetical protein
MSFRKSLGPDLKWGVSWGVWFAAGYSLLASALFFLEGTLLGQASRFSFPAVISLYIAMGVIGGLIVGLLRPVARRRIGAIALGVLVGVVVYFFAGITTIGIQEFLSLPGVVSTLVIGSVIGGACGYNSWSPEGKK